MNINPNHCFVPELHPEIAAPGKKKFARIEHFGSWCVCSPENVADWTADADDPSEYKVTEVWMTQAEFEALPEFKGF